jgi:pyridoxal phosphate-dependent aminotransferase EpsN
MHLQPLYAGCERYGGAVAADLYRRGLCLPSSSSLALEDQERVVAVVRSAVRPGWRRAGLAERAGVTDAAAP